MTDKKETGNHTTDELPDPDEADEKGLRCTVVLVPSMARAIKKAANEEHMNVPEFIRAVLRGNLKAPELEGRENPAARKEAQA